MTAKDKCPKGWQDSKNPVTRSLFLLGAAAAGCEGLEWDDWYLDTRAVVGDTSATHVAAVLEGRPDDPKQPPLQRRAQHALGVYVAQIGLRRWTDEGGCTYTDVRDGVMELGELTGDPSLAAVTERAASDIFGRSYLTPPAIRLLSAAVVAHEAEMANIVHVVSLPYIADAA